METLMCLVLLAALVGFLNREFEISYRLSFHCSLLSARDRRKIQNLKNQADWLLHNIIPSHVSEELKKNMQVRDNFKKILEKEKRVKET